MKIRARSFFLTGLLLGAMGMALATDPPKEIVVIAAASAKWVDCPGMPAGCKMSVLFGDAFKPAEFATRFKYVPGYRIGPHTHAVDEHTIVVFGGPFHVATGATFDSQAASARVLNVGDFFLVPAGVQHFAWAEGETVLQVNGIGPFKRQFVDPANPSSGVPQ
jgi:quercetin dioxygenase-like cupin family protein